MNLGTTYAEPRHFREEKKMNEPSYEEHIRMLIAFLNSDIDEELKIEMVKAFVKKFGRSDIKGD